MIPAHSASRARAAAAKRAQARAWTNGHAAAPGAASRRRSCSWCVRLPRTRCARSAAGAASGAPRACGAPAVQAADASAPQRHSVPRPAAWVAGWSHCLPGGPRRSAHVSAVRRFALQAARPLPAQQRGEAVGPEAPAGGSRHRVPRGGEKLGSRNADGRPPSRRSARGATAAGPARRAHWAAAEPRCHWCATWQARRRRSAPRAPYAPRRHRVVARRQRPPGSAGVTAGGGRHRHGAAPPPRTPVCSARTFVRCPLDAHQPTWRSGHSGDAAAKQSDRSLFA